VSAAVRVVRPGDRLPDVGSGAMAREAAISKTVCGAEKIWVGHVVLPPGMRSAKHHHGEAESAIYVISGHARFLTGRDGEEVHDAGPGDFVWVPPQVHHVEMNLSDTEPVQMIVSRSTQETLVFNVD
jgi:uncharacterized RmlC-like cupin family protein